MHTESYPDVINTEAELQQVMSRPTPQLVDFMRRLDGDIMILGASGKMGPTMAGLALRAIEAAGVDKSVIGVARSPMPALDALGVHTINCDLLDLAAVAKLPRVENIIYMVGRKFGSTGSEAMTWAINVTVAYHVARAFTGSRIAAFSTGCVYPFMELGTGGATETTPPDPVGEYAQSCLGRERMFDYYAETQGERVVHIRLNYSVELRYGVLYDIAYAVWHDQPVDMTTAFVNAIWQGDACDQVLRALDLAASPAKILNVTGPDIISVRDAALKFGALMGKTVTFTGQENGLGYLNNANYANATFGAPRVNVDQIIAWTAHWVRSGGTGLGKPTKFQVQNGKY